MKHRWALLTLTLIPVLVLAQNSFDDDVSAELDKLYTTSPAQSQSPLGNPTQVIIQQQAPQNVQRQQTTIIEATPLKESRADQMRKSRQETELLTEQKIVEKLEQSRIEDEKRRAEILFGDKFNQMMNNQQPPAQPIPQIVAPAPVPQVIVQEPVIQAVQEEPAAEELDKEMIRNEVSAALSEMQPEKKPENKTYFSVLGGMGDYQDHKNIKGSYSVGFGFGQKIKDRFSLEGSFQYSNFQIEQRDGYVYCYATGCEYYPRITDMNQYNTSLIAKYNVVDGAFSPILGGLVSYTYRTYTDKQFEINNNDAYSNSIDMGVILGADLQFSDSFSVGVDVKYLWNMTYRTYSNREFQRSFSRVYYGSDQLVEKSNYTIYSLSGKATF